MWILGFVALVIAISTVLSAVERNKTQMWISMGKVAVGIWIGSGALFIATSIVLYSRDYLIGLSLFLVGVTIMKNKKLEAWAYKVWCKRTKIRVF